MTAALVGAKLEAHNLLGAVSEEQLKAFMEAVKADADLQNELKAAGDTDAVVAIAKAAGFVILADELQRAQAEISEEELEGVAGGYNLSAHIICWWKMTDKCGGGMIPIAGPN